MKEAKPYLVPEDEDFSYPPTLEGEIERLNKEVEKQKRINEAYELDGEYALFWSLNRKQNEIARSLNSFELDLAAHKDDKSFERYNLLMKGLEDHVKSVHLLRQEYLKIPEDKLQEAEKKGIPPIEKRAANSKNKR